MVDQRRSVHDRQSRRLREVLRLIVPVLQVVARVHLLETDDVRVELAVRRDEHEVGAFEAVDRVLRRDHAHPRELLAQRCQLGAGELQGWIVDHVHDVDAVWPQHARDMMRGDDDNAAPGTLRKQKIFEQIAIENGMKVLGWRDVPVDNRFVGATPKRVEPRIRQVEKVHGAPAGVSRTAAQRGEKQAVGDARPVTNGSAANMQTMTVGSAAARPSSDPFFWPLIKHCSENGHCSEGDRMTRYPALLTAVIALAAIAVPAAAGPVRADDPALAAYVARARALVTSSRTCRSCAA